MIYRTTTVRIIYQWKSLEQFIKNASYVINFLFRPKSNLTAKRMYETQNVEQWVVQERRSF